MRRTALLLTALALVAAACGDDVLDGGATTAAPATTQAPPTTHGGSTLPPTTEAPPPPSSTLPPTTATTAAPATTTTAAPPPSHTYEIDDSDFFPIPEPGSNGAHGSGCVVPGGSMTLTDGIWFGFATTHAGGEIGFDLACFFTGQAAIDAATEDGEEAFDFYIRNNNPTIRQVPLASDARVFYVDGATINMLETTPAAWPTASSYLPCTGQYCSVWLYVNDGVATGMVEQYLP
ncbi:MAG: hypothetical protein KQH83_05075 [Actinobacteria bacterium]|nr:hypothetical protein [Actinomycetota bacterium]